MLLLLQAKSVTIAIAKELLAHGAGPNIVPNDNAGWTALIAASYKGSADIVKLLLKCGSHVNTKDREGKTVLNRAEEQAVLSRRRIAT